MKSTRIKIFLSILIPTAILAAIATFFFFPRNPIKKERNLSRNYTGCDHVHLANLPIEPTSKLHDPNEQHLMHAQKNGLKKPFATNAEFTTAIKDLTRKSILIELTENRFFQVKSLSHSQPYLIPEAIDMLNEIGYRFQTKLRENRYQNYRFRVTSVLRTEETQGNLSHRNGNATRGLSAHLYGTTVDISYKDFYNTRTDSIESSYEAFITLTKVLQEMRTECKLLGVRERHQSCFHLTVVLCKPKS